MKPDESEIELIDNVLKGDKQAFNILTKKYYTFCLNKASGIVNDGDIAKDLVQNAFMEAYFCISNLNDKNSFKQWMGGIVNNICKNYLRDNTKRYLSLKQYYEEFRDSQLIVEEKIMDIVLAAIETLDKQNEKIVYAFYYEGKSILEICNEFSITEALVKVRLHRARKELKVFLEKNLDLKEYQHYFISKKAMKKVRIIDMILGGENKKSCSLLLYDEESQRVLPIVITKEEAESMLIAMKNIGFPRPMTFNLITEIIRTNDLKPEGAYITELSGGVFISVLKLKNERSITAYDARPSDSITIALMFGCPIFVSHKIINKVGFPVPKKYENMTPQEKGIEQLTQLIENSLFEMKTKLESLKTKKSVVDIQEQVEKLMNFVFEDDNILSQSNT